MTVSYFLRERRSLDTNAEQTLLRIVDRDTILLTTQFGAVFINRSCAARVLRAYRYRVANPFFYEGVQRQFMEYEKQVTP